jgi:hypothetical protein
MSQNKNTPINAECVIPGLQQMIGGLSVFSLQQNPENYLMQERSIRCQAFSVFISSRNQYLNKLKLLGNNWISGGAEQPTEQSIDLSKDLLNGLGHWYATVGNEKFLYPKVIMSPTPAGGIAMEIELFPEKRAYVTIMNDAIAYEVETNGHYVEMSADKDNISKQLLNLYSTGDNLYTTEQPSIETVK